MWGIVNTENKMLNVNSLMIGKLLPPTQIDQPSFKEAFVIWFGTINY